jgi:hypothetical protein
VVDFYRITYSPPSRCSQQGLSQQEQIKGKHSCFKCGKTCHFIAQCPDNKNDQVQDNKGKKEKKFYRKTKVEAHIGKECDSDCSSFDSDVERGRGLLRVVDKIDITLLVSGESFGDQLPISVDVLKKVSRVGCQKKGEEEESEERGHI